MATYAQRVKRYQETVAKVAHWQQVVNTADKSSYEYSRARKNLLAQKKALGALEKELGPPEHRAKRLQIEQEQIAAEKKAKQSQARRKTDEQRYKQLPTEIAELERLVRDHPGSGAQAQSYRRQLADRRREMTQITGRLKPVASALSAVDAAAKPKPAPASTGTTPAYGTGATGYATTGKPAAAGGGATGVAPASDGGGGAGGLGGGEGGAATGGGTSLADSDFPEMGWALAIPDLANLVKQGADAGWTKEQLLGHLYGTGWWKTHGAAQRAWIALAGNDPAEAAIRLRAVGESNAILKQAADYALPMSTQAALDFGRQVVRGDITADDALQSIKDQAKSLYPGLAAAIDRGTTVEQFADPYRQIAERRLGINPATVDFSDPKWNRALNATDPKTGDRRVLDLWEWEQLVKTDPTYGYDRAPEAVQSAVNLTQAIGQMFGRVA